MPGLSSNKYSPEGLLPGIGQAIEIQEGLKGLLATPEEQLGPLAQVAKKGMELACDAYGNVPDIFKVQAPAFSLPYQNTCSDYFADNGYSPPTSDFEGGQCAVPYNIRLFATNVFNGQQAVPGEGGSLIGPITMLAKDVALTGLPCMPGDNNRSYVKYRGGDGTILYVYSGGRCNQVSAPQNAGKYAPDGTSNWHVFTRQDGQPDTCGNPPPTKPGPSPPPNRPYGTPIPLPGPKLPGTGGQDLSIGEPYLAPNGDVIQPVCVGDTCFNLLGGTSGGSARPQGDRPPETAPPLGGGQEEDLPEPPPGKKYAGALVVFSVNTVNQPPIPGTLSAKQFPVILGNASLKLEAPGTGLVFPGVASEVRSETTVLMPPSRGLTIKGVYVSVNSINVSNYIVIPLLIDIFPEEE